MIFLDRLRRSPDISYREVVTFVMRRRFANTNHRDGEPISSSLVECDQPSRHQALCEAGVPDAREQRSRSPYH